MLVSFIVQKLSILFSFRKFKEKKLRKQFNIKDKLRNLRNFFSN
jgi:hypothetical protein